MTNVDGATERVQAAMSDMRHRSHSSLPSDSHTPTHRVAHGRTGRLTSGSTGACRVVQCSAPWPACWGQRWSKRAQQQGVGRLWPVQAGAVEARGSNKGRHAATGWEGVNHGGWPSAVAKGESAGPSAGRG